MWPNPQFPVDLVTFTEEILDEKLHFFCSVGLKQSGYIKHNILQSINKLHIVCPRWYQYWYRKGKYAYACRHTLKCTNLCRWFSNFLFVKKGLPKKLPEKYCPHWGLEINTRKIEVFIFNPFSANLTKWSNTLKQFVGNLPTNCLSVFDHFVRYSH